jgi:hypothetical protein
MIFQAAMVLALSGAAAAPAASPVITFEKTTVVATGVTAGGQVAWFSVAYDRAGPLNRITRRERIDVDGGKGSVTYQLDRKVPTASIWAVVDLTSGAYAVASPGRAIPPETQLPAQAFVNGSQGQPAVLAADAELAEVLVARPGAGAWVLTVRRGESLDTGHGADQKTRVAFSSMHPVGSTTAPPSALQAGDVVIVVDSLHMTFSAARPAGPK